MFFTQKRGTQLEVVVAVVVVVNLFQVVALSTFLFSVSFFWNACKVLQFTLI